MPESPADVPRDTSPRILLPGVLCLLTCVSVLWTGAGQVMLHPPATLRELASGWVYAVPVMAILLCHEFGHYIAARIHRVPASLPFFLPLPVISPFGTLGAVIGMPERIRSRNALLDIGAAGPIAGICVALPVLLYGLTLSPVAAVSDGYYIQEGQSLLYWLLKRIVKGPIPDGHDVFLHPTAWAGWVGLFVTMINLLPWGQLDGGHIAFALLGPSQNRVARAVRGAVLLFFVYNLASFVGPIVLGESRMPLWAALNNSSTWLVWYVLLGVLGRRMGHDHPPFEPGLLSPARKGVAVACLALFVLLFMPTPLASYPPKNDADAAAQGALRDNGTLVP